jgi:hypothetical protein
LDAQIPLAEIAKSDPLATAILTEDFFTTLQVISEQDLNSVWREKVDEDAEPLNKALRADEMEIDIETAVAALREKVTKRAVDIKEKPKLPMQVCMPSFDDNLEIEIEFEVETEQEEEQEQEKEEEIYQIDPKHIKHNVWQKNARYI